MIKNTDLENMIQEVEESQLEIEKKDLNLLSIVVDGKVIMTLPMPDLGEARKYTLPSEWPGPKITHHFSD